VLFVLPWGLVKADAAILAPEKTEILFDGEEIHGLKGFTYKVYKDRQDVRGIGMNERVGLTYAEAQPDEEGDLALTTYGMPLRRLARAIEHLRQRGRIHEQIQIEGEITIVCLPEIQDEVLLTQSLSPADFAAEAGCSASPLVCEHMENHTSFQISLSVMQESYPEGLGIKQFTFDGVHIDDREFQLDSHGYALTTYTFTADRLREA
jgi:hypothetical protein